MSKQHTAIHLRTAAVAAMVTLASIAGTAAAQEVGSDSARAAVTTAGGAVGSNAPLETAGSVGAGKAEKVAETELVKKAVLKDDAVKSTPSPARGSAHSAPAIKG